MVFEWQHGERPVIRRGDGWNGGELCSIHFSDALQELKRLRAALSEMLGVLESARRGLRNLRVYRKVGRGKMAADAIGFFVAWPNAQRSRHLQPGIYRRIERGADSSVQPWFFFVAPPPYSRRFDLESIARPVVAKGFAAAFAESLEKATASAR